MQKNPRIADPPRRREIYRRNGHVSSEESMEAPRNFPGDQVAGIR